MTTTTIPTHKHASTVPDWSPVELNKTYAEKYSKTWDQMYNTDVVHWDKTKHSVIKISAETTKITFCFFPKPEEADLSSLCEISYNQDTDQFKGLCHLAKERLYEFQKDLNRIDTHEVKDKKE